MLKSPGYQVYATYRDSEDGARRWLPIGYSETEALIARLQLRTAGKFDVRIRRGRPNGPIRLRRHSR